MTTQTSQAVEAAAFRKKPVTIHAVQMTKEVAAGYVFDKKPLPDGVEFSSASHKDGKIINFFAYVNTLEGRMKVSLGDWIITGVKGEHYPCKPDIFELTYERVALTSQQEVAAPVGVSDLDSAIEQLDALDDKLFDLTQRSVDAHDIADVLGAVREVSDKVKEAKSILAASRVPVASGSEPANSRVQVSSQGVRFGKNCWYSHEKITGYSAEQLNSRKCGITGRAYMEWVQANLTPEQGRTGDEGAGK